MDVYCVRRGHLMARACVVGVWRKALDAADKKAFKVAVNKMSRADLYGAICAAAGERPFGLTALKQHINEKCVCFE